MTQEWSRQRHQMETFSALLAICTGNSPVPGEFHAQRPVTRSFDVFFDLRLNKRLSKQSWGWWFETLSCPLWRHWNEEAILAQSKLVYFMHLLKKKPTTFRIQFIPRILHTVKILLCFCYCSVSDSFTHIRYGYFTGADPIIWGTFNKSLASHIKLHGWVNCLVPNRWVTSHDHSCIK